jgi:hypothetical protein
MKDGIGEFSCLPCASLASFATSTARSNKGCAPGRESIGELIEGSHETVDRRTFLSPSTGSFAFVEFL